MLALVAAFGVLPAGPTVEAIELSVEGPIVEDDDGPITTGRAPSVGEEIFIRCRLAGKGAEVPGQVRFVFRVDGTIYRDLRVAVPTGAPFTIGEYWTPGTAGRHEIGCEVRPEPHHGDTTPGDNARRRTIEVKSRTPAPAVTAPALPDPKRKTLPAPTTPAPSPAAAAPPASPVLPADPAPQPATPSQPTTPPPGAAAAAPPDSPDSPASPVSPAAPAPKPATPPQPTPAPPASGATGSADTGPTPRTKPDLEIVAATATGDPGCGPKEPTVTVQVTVKNVGPATFVPPRNATLLEATVRIANETTLTGRKAVPRLAPGASAGIEVVARNRSPLPDAGGLRYSVVVAVNSASKVPEVTLDNNGEYVKAVFPPC